MSFGCSVGDFITALQLANNIRKRFVDAPSQFKAISDEIKSLSTVLRDVDDVLPQRELTIQQKTEVDDVARGCQNVLEELEKSLDKYQELDSSARSLGGMSRRVWKRLKWDPKDMDEFRSRITSNIVLFNAFLGRITSHVSFATKDGVDRLNRRQDDLERGVIIKWLSPVDYSTQQTDFINRRQEGTGQWLLSSDRFQQWLHKSHQTLFCPGIPGAGKTILTSIVINYLEKRFHNDSSIGIAYIYCNYQRQQEQKPAELLASLLKQLVQEQPSIPESVKSLYKSHKDKRTRPLFDEVSEVLQSVVAAYSRAFILIDALDECQVSDGGRRTLLSDIFKLQTKTGANFFATSRFNDEITKEFEGALSLEIRAIDEDLQKYLDGQMLLLQPPLLKHAKIRDMIRREVVNAVDGMFLLAQLHMDSLMSQPTIGDIKQALQNLPNGIEGLDKTYNQAMERIESQREGFRRLAKQVLSWVIHAKRPLSTVELQHALAVRAGTAKLDKDFLPEVEVLGSICAGLVTVDNKSRIIRLVHYSTQEYFKRTLVSWFPGAERAIATTCITYLSFDAFETGFCPTDEEFEERLRLYPLYDYAARNWGYHARAAPTEMEQLILDLLESEPRFPPPARL